MAGSPRARLPLAEVGLNRALQLHGQGIAVAVLGVADAEAHPAFADAVFLDVGLVLALEADADVPLQDRLVIVGAVRVDAQPVGQGRKGLIAHGRDLARRAGRFKTGGAYVAGFAAWACSSDTFSFAITSGVSARPWSGSLDMSSML